MDKKFLMILIIIGVLTGCKCQYDVVIDNNLNVSEKIVVFGDSRFKIGNDYTVYSMYDALISNYSDIYDIVKDNDFDKYVEDGNLAVSSNNSYDSINDYVNSSLIKVLYDDGLVYRNDGSIVSITSDNTVDNLWIFMDDADDYALVEGVSVNIKLPYVVTNHNADYVDTKNNIYTWDYDYNSYDKQLILEFNKDMKYSSNNLFFKIVKYLIVILVLVLLGRFVYLKLVKKRNKNNKI